MKNKTATFEQTMQSFSYHYDPHTVFDDLLTMTICAFSQNPRTHKSYDEDLYLETIAKYKNDPIGHEFPKVLATLIVEMEKRITDSSGNDVLGEYYEQHLCKRGSGQFFTPWPVCVFMAASLSGDDTGDKDKPLRIIDPCCGSGRMLLAGAHTMGKEHRFYGIDIDHMCVKMAAINLFLNGIFHAEVMWADALSPEDFRASYRTSFLPFGIFKIREKERSELWNLQQATFKANRKATGEGLQLPSESGDTGMHTGGSQLQLF